MWRNGLQIIRIWFNREACSNCQSGANRPLNTMYDRYMFVDAMYIKLRENQRVVSKAVYIATAINNDKQREILGLKMDHTESYEARGRGFPLNLVRFSYRSLELQGPPKKAGGRYYT